MVLISEKVWAAMLAAEDAHGEAAERHARSEAALARTAGDDDLARIWDDAASELHTLHTINRTWARPKTPPPAPPAQSE